MNPTAAEILIFNRLIRLDRDRHKTDQSCSINSSKKLFIMGNGISKKRNCGRCNETIYDKSGREIVVIDHWIYCNQKTETRMNELRTNNRIDSLRSEISDLQKRLSVSNEAKYKSENLVALYKRTCSTEASKFQNTIRIKDSEIEGLKEMLTKNSHRIKNQTLNLNGIQKRHQESLQKNRELENKVSQLQRLGFIS